MSPWKTISTIVGWLIYFPLAIITLLGVPAYCIYRLVFG